MFTLIFIMVIFQSKTIAKLGELNKSKDETIKLQDKVIDEQFKWFCKIKNIMKGNS